MTRYFSAIRSPFFLALMLHGHAHAQWQQDLTFPAANATAIAISPNFVVDKLALAGTHGSGVLRGRPHVGWMPANNAFVPLVGGGWFGYTLTDIDCLAISPDFVTDRVVFAGTVMNGLYRSKDRGMTWYMMAKGIPGMRIHSIALSPSFATDQTLLVGTRDAGVFRSSDGGNTFTSVLPMIDAATIAISPSFAFDQRVYLGASLGLAMSGVLRSSDGGATFGLVALAPPNVNALAISPLFAVDRRLLLGSAAGVICDSSDAGAKWTVDAGFGASSVVSAAYAPGFPGDNVLLSAVFDGVQSTLQRGVIGPGGAPTFAAAGGPLATQITTVALGPDFAATRRAFVGTTSLGLMTRDGL